MELDYYFPFHCTECNGADRPYNTNTGLIDPIILHSQINLPDSSAAAEYHPRRRLWRDLSSAALPGHATPRHPHRQRNQFETRLVFT